MKEKITKKNRVALAKKQSDQKSAQIKNQSGLDKKDLQQVIGNRAVHQMIETNQLGKGLNIQRRPTTVPAPFIGGSPFNDSEVRFTPRGVVWVNGQQTSTTDFPNGGNATVQIDAGTTAEVQLHCDVHAFEDNMFINDSWDQGFYVSWNVTAARDGTLTIEPSPAQTINPRDGGVSQSALQSINPSQGSDFVQVSPVVAGPSGTGGIGAVVEMMTNYPNSIVQRTFRIQIEVINIPEREVEITMGPVRLEHRYDVFFERPGQSTLSGDQENRLISWFESLPDNMKDQIVNGAEPIKLEGHASTTGDSARNRELSNNRTLAVQRILSQYAGNRVNFQTRSVGEYQAPTGDNTESEQERKVVVTAWETSDEE